jgi:L-ascorbate metabolism protein UlaG (beta-lactamase superfamily)
VEDRRARSTGGHIDPVL